MQAICTMLTLALSVGIGAERVDEPASFANPPHHVQCGARRKSVAKFSQRPIAPQSRAAASRPVPAMSASRATSGADIRPLSASP